MFWSRNEGTQRRTSHDDCAKTGSSHAIALKSESQEYKRVGNTVGYSAAKAYRPQNVPNVKSTSIMPRLFLSLDSSFSLLFFFSTESIHDNRNEASTHKNVDVDVQRIPEGKVEKK